MNARSDGNSVNGLFLPGQPVLAGFVLATRAGQRTNEKVMGLARNALQSKVLLTCK
jgi:hypothetical protein